jgi:hypothetical protein
MRAKHDVAERTELGRVSFLSIRPIALNARPSSEPYPLFVDVTIVKFRIIFSKIGRTSRSPHRRPIVSRTEQSFLLAVAKFASVTLCFHDTCNLMEQHMAKRLSEQLADLSVRAKSAEEALDAAEKEAHDKIAARKEQAHAAATKAIEKVNQEVKSANDTATRNWAAVKAKIADDMNHLKADIAEKKHEHDVKRAESRADRLEWEAGFAIDYAIASVEQAKLAVLDAVDGRLAAEEAKQA